VLNHFKSVFKTATRETWDLAVANHPFTVLAAFAAACLAIYFGRKFGGQSASQMNDGLISLGYGIAAYIVVFVLFFLAHFCYLTPKHMLQEATRSLAVAKSKKEREKIRTKLGEFQLEIEDRARAMKTLGPIDIVTFDQNLNATSENDQFLEEVLRYIMQNVGTAYGAMFLSDAGLPERPISITGNRKHHEHLQYLDHRALRLNQIVNEYKTD
jgi:hypothetical protein